MKSIAIVLLLASCALGCSTMGVNHRKKPPIPVIETPTIQSPIDGFQTAKFGMTYQQVKDLFRGIGKPQTIDGETRATLKEYSVLDRKGVILFHFRSDALVKADCALSYSENALSAYWQVNGILVDKYGPASDAVRKGYGTDENFYASWWNDKENGSKMTVAWSADRRPDLVLITYESLKLIRKFDSEFQKLHKSEL